MKKINHTDQLLRIDWFGGVQGNLDELDNPLIEWFFAPFDPPDPSKGELNPKLWIKDQFIAGMAVGYLPIQFIGKYFRQGNGRRKHFSFHTSRYRNLFVFPLSGAV